MRSSYYYLISSLPELVHSEEQTQHPFPAFYSFCAEELDKEDFICLNSCFIFNDLANILNHHKDENTTESAFLSPAFFDRETFNEAQKDHDLFFPFMAEALRKNKLSMDYLMNGLYEDLSILPGGFVRDYLIFELHLRNVATACSHRYLDMEYKDKIINADYISKMIAENPSTDFGLGGEVEIFKPLINGYGKKQAVELEFLQDNIRWIWLDEQTESLMFSAESVFSYALKLQIVERWLELQPETGRKLLDALVEETKNSVLENKSQDLQREAVR